MTGFVYLINPDFHWFEQLPSPTIPACWDYTCLGINLRQKKCSLVCVSYIKEKIHKMFSTFLKSSASDLSVTISRRLTMFLWFSWRKILISRTAVIGKPSFSFSSLTFFNATNSPKNQTEWIIRTAKSKFDFKSAS